MKLFKQALGALALAIAAAAHAQEPAAPDGRAILDHAATFAKDQQALAFNVKITSHVESQGTQNDAELNIEVLLQGDNHGRMRSYTSDDEAIIYSDGQERYVHLVKKEQYVKGAAVPNRREMLAMAGAGPIRMATAWIGEFITRFPDLLGKLETAEATAPGQLKLHYPSYEVDLHLGPENEPLPQRIVIDFAKSLQQQPAAIQKMTVTAEFTGWSTAPEITPDAFSWRPPDSSAPRAAKPPSSAHPHPASPSPSSAEDR
jgi:outer membrane lipoprotein-sorting protein